MLLRACFSLRFLTLLATQCFLCLGVPALSLLHICEPSRVILLFDKTKKQTDVSSLAYQNSIECRNSLLTAVLKLPRRLMCISTSAPLPCLCPNLCPLTCEPDETLCATIETSCILPTLLEALTELVMITWCTILVPVFRMSSMCLVMRLLSAVIGRRRGVGWDSANVGRDDTLFNGSVKTPPCILSTFLFQRPVEVSTERRSELCQLRLTPFFLGGTLVLPL